jgi:hypothetical protein
MSRELEDYNATVPRFALFVAHVIITKLSQVWYRTSFD